MRIRNHTIGRRRRCQGCAVGPVVDTAADPPSAARTRIIGWMLLFLMAALTSPRSDLAAWCRPSTHGWTRHCGWRSRVRRVDQPGINPGNRRAVHGDRRTHPRGHGVQHRRPNEVFLGYVNGSYLTRSPQQPDTPTCWPVMRHSPNWWAPSPPVEDCSGIGGGRDPLSRDSGDVENKPGERCGSFPPSSATVNARTPTRWHD